MDAGITYDEHKAVPCLSFHPYPVMAKVEYKMTAKK